MNSPKFYNSNGTLTKYALFCGYVEKEETEKEYKTMFIEHNHIHIQTGKHGERRSVWETFGSDELTKARKFYNGLKIN